MLDLIALRRENNKMISFRILIVTIAYLLQSSTLFAYQSDNTPVGMVLLTEGPVEVERDNSRTPPMLGDLLLAGDRLITGTGQVTLIYCPTQQMITVPSDTIAVLGASEFEVAAGPPPTLKAARGCALPEVALGEESLEHIGGLRVRGYAPIPLYLGGKVSVVRPTFRWAKLEGAETFHLTLSNLVGEKLWEYETTELSAPYPDTRPPLEEGSYLWELRGQAGARTTGFQNALFLVEPGPTPPTESGADDPFRLLRAMELESSGYYAEAAAELRAMLSGGPPDKRILGRMAWLYWNAGLIAAADEAMKRLKDDR